MWRTGEDTEEGGAPRCYLTAIHPDVSGVLTEGRTRNRKGKTTESWPSQSAGQEF